MKPASHLKLVSGPVKTLAGAADAVTPDSLAARFDGTGGARVRAAADWALPRIAGQTLPGGEPLETHVLATAQIVTDLGLGPDAAAAAIAIPAATVPEAELAAALGADAARLALGAARMRTIESLSGRAHARLEADARARELENLRKMLLAMVEDPRVVLIKLADHTQTLRAVVKSADTAARTAAAQLALDLFAPLANRLGVWQLKWELEDLAFRILEPEVYKGLARRLDEKRGDRERYIAQVIATLDAELKANGIRAEVSGRPKHIHSIWKKMQRKGLDFEALYDVRAVRVLVEDVKDCYAALGLVHHLWTPIPREFDDYIAKPKANDYRSLHTAVIGPEGKAVEVQIRTREMHQASELGVAAHWRYKEGARTGGRRGADERIAWLRQVLDWRNDVADAGELASEFKTRLLDDTIYVLTPEGQVIDLPAGATPVDFAYHVHSGLGHRCRGAKVDGVMVPLNTPLKNGQQVEILAAKTGGPSRDWLNASLGYLQSPSARSRVRQWFNRQNLEHAIAQGRAVVEKELARRGATAMPLDRVARALDYAKTEQFLADVGRGKLGPRALELAISPPPATPAEAPVTPAVRKRPASSAGNGILVVGVDRLLTVTGKCCKPAPPDAIVGFVTRGHGVTIHRADCANVARLDRARLMAAEWGARDAGASYPADILVEADDRTGLLRDITEVFTRERVNVTATNTASRDRSARMHFTIQIGDRAQLARVLAEIRRVKGVGKAVRRK